MSNVTSSIKKYVNRKQFKYGGYAVLITLIGIAVIVFANIGLTALENNFDLRLDMSQNKAYTLNDQTKMIAGDLTKDVYIYTLYAPGQEDNDALAILKKIKALSGHITLENKDPGSDPAFINKFQTNGSTIEDGSIIVTDKDNKVFQVLNQYAQYSNQYDDYSNLVSRQIKVEGAVTSAINYIQLGYMPTVFLVQGHAELPLSDISTLSANFSNQNYNLQTINIGQTPEKVKPGDIILFMRPQVDITDSERDALTPLMLKGGRFFFLLDPLSSDPAKMPNLMSLLKQYDIELKDGLVVENDLSYLYPGQNHLVLEPELQSHAITDVIISRQLPVVIPGSGVIKLPEVPPDSTMKMTSLLKTSDQSYFKTIEEAQTDMSQQPDDEVGPFDVGVAVEKNNGGDVADDVRFVLFYNTDFATVQGAGTISNIDLVMNSAAWMRNSAKDIYVRPKAISTPQIVIKNMAQFWTITMVSVLLVPLLMLAAGIFIYLRRKHL
jgi:ABC-2 type transport system permease protein